MSAHYGRQLPPDPRVRARAFEQARAEGRLGAQRLSDEVLLATGPDPSDTFIGLALDHLEIGQRERFVQDEVPEASGDAASPAGSTVDRTNLLLSGPEEQRIYSVEGPQSLTDVEAA